MASTELLKLSNLFVVKARFLSTSFAYSNKSKYALRIIHLVEKQSTLCLPSHALNHCSKTIFKLKICNVPPEIAQETFLANLNQTCYVCHVPTVNSNDSNKSHEIQKHLQPENTRPRPKKPRCHPTIQTTIY